MHSHFIFDEICTDIFSCLMKGIVLGTSK